MKRASQVAAKRQTCRRPLLVGIAGGSGSGKTWLAGRLKKLLGPQACVLSLDDFYRDRSHLPPGRRARLNFDHPRAIDWQELEAVLADYLAGRRTSAPVYDFATHARVPNQRKRLPRAELLILEGLWLFRRPSLRRLFSLKVYMECPVSVRLQRRLERDLQSRGRTRASVLRQFRDMVEPMHRRHVEPQARWADWVLRAPVGKQLERRILIEVGFAPGLGARG